MNCINENNSKKVEHKEHFHGSDLEKIEAVYGIKKEEIISFSANVNPLGLAPKVKTGLSEHIDCLTAYPDREYTALRKSIGSYVNSSFENILVGNGSTELISLFAKLCNPKHAIIFGPTYSEYEHEISLCGGKSSYFELKESDNFVADIDELKKQISASLGSTPVDLLIICNPNNPTSALISREVMNDIVSFCNNQHINVIVDETYMEFVEDFENVTAIELTKTYSNLVVLRGISKFFASPGLRLGYGVTSNQELISGIKGLQIPWSINSLAEVAGKLMFEDTKYIIDTKNYIAKERNRIYSRLLSIPALKVYKPTANFIMCKIISGDKTAQDLFDEAIKEKLMIRDCASFTFLDESFFRLCFMKEEDNNRLLEVIERVFS